MTFEPVRLPLSPEALLTLGSLPETLPNLWYGAPHPAALRARALLRANGRLPTGLRGRTGLALVRTATGAVLWCAHEPFREPAPTEGLPYPAADRLVGELTAEGFEGVARRTLLTDGTGETLTLRSWAEALFAAKPEKIARGGGAGLNLTHAHWRRALSDALATPAVRLLNALNAERRRARAGDASAADGELLLYFEWWEGASPTFDLKHDQMPLAPRTTVKALVERLLAGHAMAADPRLTDPRVLAKRPRILEDTHDWVVIEKPSGLLSVPGTLGLKDAMTRTAEALDCVLTPVHRLDMDTSGLLVYTKTLEATKALMAAFREGRVEKRYLALLESQGGRLAETSGEVRLPITTNPLDRLRQVVAAGGRPSHTLWRRLGERNGMTLVELTPVTGRTHQLRIHAGHALGLNAPIHGDPYYSAAGLAAETPDTPLCLHAAQLAFPDPKTGRMRRFATPAPFADDV